MTGNEFARFDAIALADQIRRKMVSASEVLEASIASIDNLNPRLNAVICRLYAQARDQLSVLNPESPLYGVPFLAKDLFAEIAGTPLHEGSEFLKGCYRSTEDSELVTRWREAGLVLVGKTNTPEFGMKPDCEPKIYGCSINPWAHQNRTQSRRKPTHIFLLHLNEVSFVWFRGKPDRHKIEGAGTLAN
jgi:amidase